MRENIQYFFLKKYSYCFEINNNRFTLHNKIVTNYQTQSITDVKDLIEDFLINCIKSVFLTFYRYALIFHYMIY